MSYLELCLVVNTATGQWRVETRPPVKHDDPRFEWTNAEWSDVLSKACKDYRKKGEKFRK